MEWSAFLTPCTSRMARIEGLFAGFTRREVGNVSKATPGLP